MTYHRPKRRWFKCSVCGQLNTATKRGDKMTAPGHVKHFWCWKCAKITKQYQISGKR